MYYYYITDGPTGPLVNTGIRSTPVEQGPYINGWYIYPGTPSDYYTNKSSEFDLWDSGTLSWVKNPDEQQLLDEKHQQAAAVAKEHRWILVRARRNKLLQESDWTQLPDVPIATKEAWAVYRQSLRDVTLQPDPFNITWPVPPQE